MLEGDPDNTAVMFGLAKEYEKAGRFDDMVECADYLSAPTTRATPTACWPRPILRSAARRGATALRARRRSRSPTATVDGAGLPTASLETEFDED